MDDDLFNQLLESIKEAKEISQNSYWQRIKKLFKNILGLINYKL